MSDQDIKEQIERDADIYAKNFILAAHQRTARKAYIDGAQYWAVRLIPFDPPEVMPGSSCTPGNHEHDCVCAAYSDGYRDSATAHDKIATNRTAEAVKAMLDNTHFAHTGSVYKNFIKELEKLKR